ncbi:hypothetical protein [Thauera linaloolentis]|uniref:Uncharacterized protein n=1 Tax=Thauera linaloolentis (strain DSM 12138 / JCM 21573 / CCUG 41526 / CIP 105981 / IAM 15112 / NBRC 102519 / 47Lol) TaxID=1123367 RepID=N6Z4K4_THAL4|nr:hypothetical protein [Thauera linaloolentis]ENO89507.1 hypothetical protein C666_05625 [Thauera linaloolentis 47Lol = DSM 12138]MCM8565402.1 hypothetical protein [Thauera linaloolentis]
MSLIPVNRLCMFILLLGMICPGVADAQSRSQSLYASCMNDARKLNADCRKSNTSRVCNSNYRRNQDTCWKSFMNHGSRDAYYGGNPPRYEPVPIPRRPTYLLPGSR